MFVLFLVLFLVVLSLILCEWMMCRICVVMLRVVGGVLWVSARLNFFVACCRFLGISEGENRAVYSVGGYYL